MEKEGPFLKKGVKGLLKWGNGKVKEKKERALKGKGGPFLTPFNWKNF